MIIRRRMCRLSFTEHLRRIWVVLTSKESEFFSDESRESTLKCVRVCWSEVQSTYYQ